MTRRWSMLGALALIAGCAKPESPEVAATRMANQVAELRTIIDAKHGNWVRFIAAGQPESLATHYAANARVMGANEPVLRGRDAVIASFSGMMQAGTWHFTLTTDSVWANGPLVIATGKWSYHLARAAHPPAGMPAIDSTGSGSFMQRWTLEDGEWRLADDIYNSDQPLPAPPPARSR